MQEQEWLESQDPVAMLAFLQTCRRLPGPRPPSERKLRLFACACVRQVRHFLDDYRSRAAVDFGELLADNLDSPTAARLSREMTEDGDRDRVSAAANAASGDTARLAALAAGYESRLHAASRAADAALALVGTVKASDVAWQVLGHLSWSRDMPTAPGFQADLLRDVVGNPFRPARRWNVILDGLKGNRDRGNDLDEAWLNRAVLDLARAAYEHRAGASGRLDSVTLAAVADALEEAGCAGDQGRTESTVIYVQRVDGSWFVLAGIPSGARILYRTDNRTEAVLYAEDVCQVKQWQTRPHLQGLPAPAEQTCWGQGLLPLPDEPHPVLAHLRSPGPHVMGCWALDLVLGRE